MRVWIMLMIAAAIGLAGCAKKEEAASRQASASPSASPAGQAGTANPSASPATGGEAGGGSEAGAGKATEPPKNLPGITKAQSEQLGATSTYDDLVRVTGSKGTLVKEESGKKTYEFQLKDEAGYYVYFTYFSDGKLAEKGTYQR